MNSIRTRPLAAVVILARASDLKGIWQAVRVVVSEGPNLDVQVPAFAPATALHTAREDALGQVWHSSCDAQMRVCPGDTCLQRQTSHKSPQPHTPTHLNCFQTLPYCHTLSPYLWQSPLPSLTLVPRLHSHPFACPLASDGCPASGS